HEFIHQLDGEDELPSLCHPDVRNLLPGVDLGQPHGASPGTQEIGWLDLCDRGRKDGRNPGPRSSPEARGRNRRRASLERAFQRGPGGNCGWALDLLPVRLMSRIRSLRPNVTREEAAAEFSPAGPAGLVRHLIFGPLRSVADFYLPFRLFQVVVGNAGKRDQHILGLVSVMAAVRHRIEGSKVRYLLQTWLTAPS